MVNHRIVLLFGLAAALTAGALEPEIGTLKLLRKDHPRLFVNKETLPAVRKRALTVEKKMLDLLRMRVERFPENPRRDFDPRKLVKQKDGTYKFIRPAFMISHAQKYIGGVEARDSAFLYLITGEKKYFVKAKNHLLFSVDLYEWALANQHMVEWEHKNYEGSICAYDWICNELTPEERKKIVEKLLYVVREIQMDGKATFRRNGGGPTTGFYGSERLHFYTGAAFYGDGINDKEAQRQLLRGISKFNEVLQYREKISAGTGALVHHTIAYTFGEYPETCLNYFFAVRSAFGVNEAARWNHMQKFPEFVDLNWIPYPGRPREFGLGDCHHLDNFMPVYSFDMTMRSIAELYPEHAERAKQIHARLSERLRSRYRRFTTYLMTSLESMEPVKKVSQVPRFQYIPTVGVAYFRSGSSMADTYACFRSGGKNALHCHYDQNHFVIYHQGYLALDSGTRGLNQSFHLPYYYAQSIAHNTILIDMPREKIGYHWGPGHHGYKSPVPFMDGGQYRKLAPVKTKTVNTKEYAGILSDATGSYRPEKCKLAEREFLHLRPHLFLVIDRVKSAKKEYRKRWLLHTQQKPQIEGNVFTNFEEKGKLVTRCLWPQKVKVELIGGPGREFWASGKNWELHPVFDKNYKGKLHGNWRIEVSPEEPAEFDMFVHLLHASPAKANFMPVKPEISQVKGGLNVTFTYAFKKWQIFIPSKNGIMSQIKVSPITSREKKK